jgi:hypothetical protein
MNCCELILNFRSIGKRPDVRSAGTGQSAGGARGPRRLAAARRALIDKVKAGA